MNRKTLEELTRHLIDRTLKISENCLKKAGLTREDLNDVLLVGGQTCMPFLGDRVSNFLDDLPPNRSIRMKPSRSVLAFRPTP
ncbi:MAG: Hsp70 family protein [Bdellovibrionota bacterium]